MLQEKFDSLSRTALGQRRDGNSRNIMVSYKRFYKCKLYYLSRIWYQFCNQSCQDFYEVLFVSESLNYSCKYIRGKNPP